MATNRVYAGRPEILPDLAVLPVDADSGGPVVIGKIPGVALKDADSDHKTIVQTDGIFDLSVKDTATGGIAVGDILYFDNATTPKVNNTNTGIRYGYALEVIANGLTDTINVLIGY